MVNKSLHINIADYDYNLPQECIAKYPFEKRDKAKLLVYNGKEIAQRLFSDLPSLLPAGSLLVFNDTKVVNERLFFEKDSGATIEIFCLEPFEPCEVQQAFAQTQKCVWKCLIGNNKRWKDGDLKKQEFALTAKRLQQNEDAFLVEFTWEGGLSFSQVLETAGVIPLPPYIKRSLRNEDSEDYQTIYATSEGSVAAPTAGLHFTEKTFEDLKIKDVKCCFLTLHVGAGTFKPVTTNDVSQHVMHTEKVEVTKSLLETVLAHIQTGITAVGTTSVRTLESLFWYGVAIIENGGDYLPMEISQWQPYEQECAISPKEALCAIVEMMNGNNMETLYGSTQVIIAPPYRYKIVDSMITNFHQPKSTLLLLISTFLGEDWRQIYAYALEQNFRFLSFGDACYFSNRQKNDSN